MNISVSENTTIANSAAARCFEEIIAGGAVNVMLAAGNTPIEFYRLIAARGLELQGLRLFALDEYVGVPLDEPRNCANLIRDTAVCPWGVPLARYFTVSSLPEEALASVQVHEARIAASGGLDLVILGLGQNGHLGFNEPGSAEDSIGRVLDLETISVEANRLWFGGHYAPSRGVTVGLRTILGARRVMILAYGPHKAAAVRAMLQGPRDPACPASFLQSHPYTSVFLDCAAAAALDR